jgi:hypothetical protein
MEPAGRPARKSQVTLAAGRSVVEAKVGKTQSRAHLSNWFSQRLRKVFELDP